MFATRFRTLFLLPILLVSAVANAAPPRDDDVVAIVNGAPILRRSVRAIVQGTIVSQESDSPPDAATVRRLAQDALDSLIDFELLYQASQTRDVAVSDAAVEEEIRRTEENFGDKKAFASALQSQGLTESDLRRDTRKSLAVNRLLEGEVLRDARVTSEQIEEFYQQNQAQFQHPAQTRASHILIRVGTKASKSERSAAQKKAAQIRELIDKGGDFAELARQHSEDPGTAPFGGDLGFYASGEMDESIEKTARALDIGQISAVTSSSYGYHIIKVTDRRGAGYETLAEVQERIRAALLKNDRRQRQTAYVAELRKSATIQYPSQL